MAASAGTLARSWRPGGGIIGNGSIQPSIARPPSTSARKASLVRRPIGINRATAIPAAIDMQSVLSIAKRAGTRSEATPGRNVSQKYGRSQRVGEPGSPGPSVSVTITTAASV